MTLKDIDTHSSEMKIPITYHAAAALAKALIQYNSMTGFFQRLRRGSVFLIISGSLTILLNTSIRNNIYDFISNLLKTIVRISNDSPASVSTGGLNSNPTGVISIPPNDIVGGTPLQYRLLISHL